MALLGDFDIPALFWVTSFNLTDIDMEIRDAKPLNFKLYLTRKIEPKVYLGAVLFFIGQGAQFLVAVIYGYRSDLAKS